MTHVEQIRIRADVYLGKYAGLFSCGEPRPITLGAATLVGSAFLTGNQMFKASSLRGSQNKIKVSKSQREIPDQFSSEEKLVSIVLRISTSQSSESGQNVRKDTVCNFFCVSNCVLLNQLI